jgi:hypothetical protein
MALDLKLIHEAVAEALEPVRDGFDVFAFPEPSVTRPKFEVVPGGSEGEYVSYFGTFGADGRADAMVTVRVTVLGLTAQDRALAIWRLAGSGSTVPRSIVDALMVDQTLGGVVETLRPLTGSWDEDADTFEVPVAIVARKSGAQV